MSLATHIAAVCEDCTECQACAKQCGFLAANGTPKALAGSYAANPARVRALAYECSLCGLCAAVCPYGVDPGAMFLELRREACRLGEVDMKRYRVLLGYEARGNSAVFSSWDVPEGCQTVFFPGCNLPGSRPGVVRDVLLQLRATDPRTGIVLACCSKPSHDLGRQDHFAAAFGALRDGLVQRGVRRVLIACPNCFKVFKTYGAPLVVQSVYEVLRESGFGPTHMKALAMTMHDPCPLRREEAVHEAVRGLAAATGVAVQEMRHARKRTLCCGEGGAVGFYRPELARAWSEKRVAEAAGLPMLTYCAGCADCLRPHAKVVHVLDLLFRPRAVAAGRARVLRSPFTYLARLWLKRILVREKG